MSIPLVQNNEKDSINTSIVAIKKNLERINSILGLVDSESDIDTSEFVKKSDIVDVVQSGNMNPVTSNAVATSNAMPVNTVTSGDMHSVTSNAVASRISTLTSAINTKLKVVNNVRPRFDVLNVTSANESDFIKAVINKYGSPALLNFTYSWSANVLVKCYSRGSNLINIDMSGGASLYVQGNFSSGSWDSCTYLILGGSNQSGSGVNRICLGFLTYNGGSTLTKDARSF